VRPIGSVWLEVMTCPLEVNRTEHALDNPHCGQKSGKFGSETDGE
jgi:hypothetical protein